MEKNLLLKYLIFIRNLTSSMYHVLFKSTNFDNDVEDDVFVFR